MSTRLSAELKTIQQESGYSESTLKSKKERGKS